MKFRFFLAAAAAALAAAAAMAQSGPGTRHSLGLFGDVVADTVTVPEGMRPVPAGPLLLRHDPAALPPGTGGDRLCTIAFDADADGDQDLFLGHIDGHEGRALLLRNDGSGAFTEVQGSGLPDLVTHGNRADLDNDGLCDLIVAAQDRRRTAAPTLDEAAWREPEREYQGEVLLVCRNLGGMRFHCEPVPRPEAGAAADWPGGDHAFWSPVVITDLDRDGLVDALLLQSMNIVARFVSASQLWVLHNRNGRLAPVRAMPMPAPDPDRPGTPVMSACDVDNDGWPDVTMLPRSGFFVLDSPLVVLRNREGVLADTADTLDVGREPKSGDPHWLDADADGDLDLLATQYDAQGGRHTWYLNEGGAWRSLGAEAGLWSAYSIMTGLAWGDLDQDGLPDIVPNLNANNVTAVPIPVLRNLGGGRFGRTLEAFDPLLTVPLFSSVLADLDGDLDLDLVATPRSTWAENAPPADLPARIYRNETAGGRAMLLELVGIASNRSAIGARIDVAAGGRTMRMVVGTGLPAGQSVPPLVQHVGLGQAEAAERVTVRWPSGLVEWWDGLAAGRRWVLSEGSGTASP